VPLLEGTSPPWRETLLIEAWNPTQAWSGLRIDDERGRWKYVENTRGFAELYDLDGDPFELSNLANQPSRAAFVSQLAAELAPQKGVASRTHSAPNGKPGTAYSRALLAWGGAPPYTWRLFQGMLPPGLRITSGANPLLSGTPTAPGTWSFVLEVRDTSTNTVRSGPQVYRQPLELRIVAVCEDGVDNDGDGRVDYPADPGCAGPLSMLENPQCDDRIDNDLDGGIDFAGTPPDPQCKASWRNQEQMSSCGLGFEIAFVLAPLALWRARRRRAFPAVVAAALAVAAAASPAGAAATYLFSFGSPQVPTPETFGWVTGVAVDSSTGDVFIPTEGPIRRFDDQGNFIVGFGSCQGCRGMDVDVVTHDLYAADGNSNRILQYTKEGQLVRQWGTTGTGNGQFASLYDVSIDAAGRRIFAIDGTRIQVFDLQGNFVRAWGSVGQGWGQFSGNATGQPYGVSYDPSSGTVWASDSFLDRIYAFDDVGNLLGGWDDNGGGHGPGQMRWVRNLDVDAVGNVYECDSDNERIQVFAPDGSFVDEFRGPHDLANGPFHPRGIAVNRTTGEKWVAAAYAQRVDKFDAANEYLFSLGDRQRDGMTMWVPLAIAVSPTTGDVFVDDKNNFLVKRFSRDGRFRTQWGGSVRLDPYSDGRFGYDARVLLHRAQTPLAVDPDGNLWVAGYGTRYLGDPHYHFARRLGPLGNFIDGWLPLVPVTEAYGELALGIAVDPVDRRVYISDGQTDRVRVHSTTGGVLRTISVPDPGGIAPAADGIYVVSAGTQTVRKYARNGTLLLQWGGPGIAPGKFDFLVGGIGAGIALDSTGKVYVADAENNRVQVFDPDGNFLEVIGSVGTTPGKFRTPYALAIAKDSDTLYVLDTGNTRVQAFALPTSPACFDGIDNDGDGKIDFTRDRGCANALSAIENPSCDDGYDNDGDGKIDFDGNPPDPDCTSASANREFRRACGLGFEVLLPLVPLAWCASRRRRPAAP
jgi:DNA-binding beta-propeller fold protein YncE